MGIEATWKAIFEFDAQAFINQAAQAIWKAAAAGSYKGVIFGASGGIDSLLTAVLCLRAEKPTQGWRVVGLQMVDSRVRGESYNPDLYQRLGCELVYQDITGQAVEAEKRMHLPSRRLTILLLWILLKGSPWKMKEKLALAVMSGKAHPHIMKHFELLTHLHKLRVCRLRHLGREEKLMPVICANRTERSLGYFVEGGIDDPLMGGWAPIAHLYKTQVKAASGAIGIPAWAIGQSPSPGFGGIRDDDILGPYEVADLALAAIEAGFSDHEIQQALKKHFAAGGSKSARRFRRWCSLQHIGFLRRLNTFAKTKSGMLREQAPVMSSASGKA